MTWTIHRLKLASVELAGQFNPPSYRDARIDVLAYLLTSEPWDPILIDSGVGKGVPAMKERFKPERASLIDQLSELGIEPGRVEMWRGSLAR